MKKFSDIFRYKPLNKYEGLYGKYPTRAGTTYIGVELEMENVQHKYSNLPSSFSQVADGSLKLEGQEFITIPIHFCYLEQELERLFSCLQPPLLSKRCSTHVHLNARDLTFDELQKFILLYMIFEKSLFKVADNRWENEFCVPLYSAPSIVKDFLRSLINQDQGNLNWYKYFSLNVCPLWGGESITKLGTVEFRHMAGTTDVKKIIFWVNLIVSLKISAKKFNLPDIVELISTMNTTSAYYKLAGDVFKEFSSSIVEQPTFKADVESCITLVKTILFDTNKDH